MLNKDNQIIKLDRVKVDNLFGKMDYDISLMDATDVSIIIAPNGYGKTAVLKLICAALNPTSESFHAIEHVVFDSVSCYLSNGKTVTLSRVKTAKKNFETVLLNDPKYSYYQEKMINNKLELNRIIERRNTLVKNAVSYQTGDNEEKSLRAMKLAEEQNELKEMEFNLEKEQYMLTENIEILTRQLEKEYGRNDFDNAYSILEKEIKNLGYNYCYRISDSNRVQAAKRARRNNTGTEIDFINKMIQDVSLINLISRRITVKEADYFADPEYQEYVPRECRVRLNNIINLCAKNLYDEGIMLDVNFITSHRLKKVSVSQGELERDNYKSLRKAQMVEIDPLTAASVNVGKMVSACVNEYKNRKDQASNDLPREYAKKCLNDSKGYDRFKDRWSSYLKKIKLYSNMGFLDEKEADFSDISAKQYEKAGTFFDVYLDTFESSISCFDEIYEKFNLFKQIFDERTGSNAIASKSVLFTPNGIRLFLDGNIEFPITELSSGEKNDFLMFYNLVFMSKPGQLFLIDEPEISLHIEWQESYVDRLLDICNENKIQVILTTHSPHIINGHFDLIKDL